MSPHIGEMDSPRSLDVFERVVTDLQALYGVRAERIISDAHPGYRTHRWAQQQGLPVDTVWHHEAHASAVVGEYGVTEDCLVFTWDGVGLGADGNLWGGEALFGRAAAWQRVASLRSFRSPGVVNAPVVSPGGAQRLCCGNAAGILRMHPIRTDWLGLRGNAA